MEEGGATLLLVRTQQQPVATTLLRGQRVNVAATIFLGDDLWHTKKIN
jgi:hypothetical protein